MLALYARVHQLNHSNTFREICDGLLTGGFSSTYESVHAVCAKQEDTPQSSRASEQTIHRTYSALLSMLSLTPAHLKHLQAVRGLTAEQIERFGFKSTPQPHLCHTITERLIKDGYTVQGVPGFYVDDNGKWTLRYFKRTSGIIVPYLSVDGLIQGLQTRLDVPLKGKSDPPDKVGTKYLWLTTADKPMGASSGSPAHFVGNPCSRVVYVTEGALKADVAHALMKRTFIATSGAGCTSQLDDLFAFLQRNGTEEIIEAEDMDKYSNKGVERGASKVYLLAKKYGMKCRRLTWNPNYKGIDDWQLALRQKVKQGKEHKEMTFKERYLSGECGMEYMEKCAAQWNDRRQRFRVYQLILPNTEVIPFAFQGIAALYKAGYQQPPAAQYGLIYDGELYCPTEQEEENVLARIFSLCNDHFPDGYAGRSLSPSDVVELYDDDTRKYFYCDTSGFVPVKFSPMLTKHISSPQNNGNG